jgi:hypothetical protein
MFGGLRRDIRKRSQNNNKLNGANRIRRDYWPGSVSGAVGGELGAGEVEGIVEFEPGAEVVPGVAAVPGVCGPAAAPPTPASGGFQMNSHW